MKSCQLFNTVEKHSNLFLIDRQQIACARCQFDDVLELVSPVASSPIYDHVNSSSTFLNAFASLSLSSSLSIPSLHLFIRKLLSIKKPLKICLRCIQTHDFHVLYCSKSRSHFQWLGNEIETCRYQCDQMIRFFYLAICNNENQTNRIRKSVLKIPKF